jgi:hypothetical protein
MMDFTVAIGQGVCKSQHRKSGHAATMGALMIVSAFQNQDTSDTAQMLKLYLTMVPRG